MVKASASSGSALVISTTPPVPRNYGNRNRVFQTIEFLKNLGFSISFLLYPFDEEWADAIPDYHRSLIDEFDYYAVVPNSRQLHQEAKGSHHDIDEWWDDNLGQKLTWLFKRKRFDILFVNYTFMSRAFDYAPKSVLRVLDTHDVFTDRRENFEKHGVRQEFFYTTAAQEKIAFERADAIIAIKSSEADFIRTITKKHVVTIPYYDSNPVYPPVRRDDKRPVFSHDRPLRLGFIGAQNTVNVVNMQRFLHIFDRYVRLYNLPVEIIVAGNVCRQLHKNYFFLRKLGHVAHIQDFYLSIDAVIAPLEFSTGMKIKVAEALVWEMPVIATKNAFDGFRAFHSTQAEANVATLCQSIASVATNEIPFAALVIAAQRSALAAQKAQEKGFSDFRTWIRKRAKRIVVVTDRPFWHRRTFRDELIAQTIEYLSKIALTIVCLLTKEDVKPEQVYAQVDYLYFDSVSDVASYLGTTGNSFNVLGSVLLLDRAATAPVVEQSGRLGVTSWIASLSRTGSKPHICFRSSKPGSEPVVVAPLRYIPPACERMLSPRLVALLRPCEPTEWDDAVCDYIVSLCKLHDLTLTEVQVPPHAEYARPFFEKTMLTNASRVILFSNDVVSSVFGLQAAQYRGARILAVAPDFACPDMRTKESDPLSADTVGQGGLPSLASAISQFLSGEVTAHVPAGANTGWSEIWDAFEMAGSQ